MKKLVIALLAVMLVVSCAVAMAETTQPEHITNCTQLGNAHTAGEWILSVPATCTSKGQEALHCSVCNAVMDHRDTAKAAHSFGEWYTVTEGDCITTGTEARACACGETETRATAAVDHAWGEWIVITDSTCTTLGEEYRYCAECEAFEKNEIALKKHNFVNVVDYDSTCTAVGAQHLECSVCETEWNGENYGKPEGYKNEIPMKAHVLVALVLKTEATCTVDGTYEAVCAVCHNTFDKDTTGKGAELTDAQKAELKIPATDHNWVVGAVVAPTCVTEGSVTYVCANECGIADVVEILPAEERFHVLKATVVTEPTETTKGLKHIECTVEGCDYFVDVLFDLGNEPEDPETETPVIPDKPSTDKPEADNGTVDNGTTNTPATTPSGVVIPATGDNTTNAAYVVLAAAIVGLAVLAISKKARA